MSLSRRDLFRVWATSASGFLASCAEPLTGATRVVETPDGPVLQWEKDELLVLVAGLRSRYQRGDRIQLKVTINNQSDRVARVRFRTRLVGRGQQVVAEAPVASVTIGPFDAETVEKELPITAELKDGDYTLRIELPPWLLDDRQTGGGGLSAGLQIG